MKTILLLSLLLPTLQAADRAFLKNARQTAHWLQSCSRQTPNGKVWPADPLDSTTVSTNLYSGSSGGVLFFLELHRATQNKIYLKKSARGLVQSGIPEKQTPGFWNNVSQCCGSAGVAEFFLSLYRATKERPYLDFAKQVTANLLTRATREGDALKWIQAEHRVKPDLLIAQTGYMQGAAGIGMLLLHMDALAQGRAGGSTLPDSPF